MAGHLVLLYKMDVFLFLSICCMRVVFDCRNIMDNRTLLISIQYLLFLYWARDGKDHIIGLFQQNDMVMKGV